MTAIKPAAPGENYPIEPSQPTELRDANEFCLKPLRFGLLCYTAVENQNRAYTK